MKNFKRINSAVALICLICVSLLCFAGCGSYTDDDVRAESDKNKQLATKFFNYVLEDKQAEAYKMVKGSCSFEEFSESYATFREAFEGATDFEIFRYSEDGFTTKEDKDDESFEVYCDNVYELELDNGRYLTATVSTSSLSDKTIDFVEVDETTTFRKITGVIMPIINIAIVNIYIGTIVFTVFMIIDCAKRRIKLKVLWMFILFAAMTYSASLGGEFSLGYELGVTLEPSYIEAYPVYETIDIYLSVPAGAIIYFFVREHLPTKPPKEKKEEEAVAVAETPVAADPTVTEPVAEAAALPSPEETAAEPIADEPEAVEEATEESATEETNE